MTPVTPVSVFKPPRLRVVADPPQPSDAKLVDDVRAGDRGAEEAVYRRYAPAVLSLATRLLGRQSDAEDTTQDTFLIAFERIHQLRDAASLRPWLLCIAVSQVRRRFRTRRLLRALGLTAGHDDVTLESLAAPGIDAEARADLAALDRVLATLPPAQRIAWMLRNGGGRARLEDVARACHCSLATAKRRIAVADAHVHAEVDATAVLGKP